MFAKQISDHPPHKIAFDGPRGEVDRSVLGKRSLPPCDTARTVGGLSVATSTPAAANFKGASSQIAVKKTNVKLSTASAAGGLSQHKHSMLITIRLYT